MLQSLALIIAIWCGGAAFEQNIEVLHSEIKFLGDNLKPQNIASRPDAHLAPFLMHWEKPLARSDDELRAVMDTKNPLQIFSQAFRLLVRYQRTKDESALVRATMLIDYMLDGYKPSEVSSGVKRWLYGFDYKSYVDIRSPWWSGMPDFFGPLVLYAAWEITKNPRYLYASVGSAKLALLGPEQGGVIWRSSKGCWISSYVWNNISDQQEFFVLNGHLWGLQALYLLASATGEKALRDGYECARRGFFNRELDFYNNEKSWTWYQLNPKVINPTHYNLLELAQFRALRLITGDRAYRRSENARRVAFERGYPLVVSRGRDGQLWVNFSMIGPPHPYWTDTYAVNVNCFTNGVRISRTGDKQYSSHSLDQRLVVRFPIPKRPSQCQLAVENGVDVYVYKKDKFLVVEDSKQLTEGGQLSGVGLDARSARKNRVVIARRAKVLSGSTDSLNDEARITFSVEGKLGSDAMLAIVLRSEKRVPLGMFLEDRHGVRSSRYYPALEPNLDNIVIVNRLGFDGNDALVSAPESLTLRVYTANVTDDFSIDVVGYYLLSGPVDVNAFFLKHAGAHFIQQ
ncbi:D-glucuronyl C5-epimerase family protein [Thauera sp. 2A1]|uniref:D-glucuronyl C5-epimerase family protein n=1 Tax=Thauera sp. 2A1 TaxID=2570191 RepID=UPI00188599CF|nr:D-glucuronyl C5-epimerase family protein [Thauera sp. 2A1]KAI5914814.1 D-glucuronyl C5-epimerase family protein [Thauera sp. 2A1]